MRRGVIAAVRPRAWFALCLAAAAVGAVVLSATALGASKLPTKINGAQIIAPKKCGQSVTYKQTTSAFKSLSAATQKQYGTYPALVQPTPWKSFKGKKGPWKIGYISFPISNPWKVDFLKQLKSDYAKAKKQGLVSGNLQLYIQPSSSTATPEQQDAAIQQMVSRGVDLILIHPVNAVAESKAIDAAGEKGVPVVVTSDIAPNSKYALNVFGENQTQSFADTLALLDKAGLFKKTVNTLDLRGIPGNVSDTIFHTEAVLDMAPCPNINVLTTLIDGWNPAQTKSVILQYLAAHPQQIDYVMNEGAVAAGVIEAFQSLGKPVPPQPFGGAAGGELGWWLQNRKTYNKAVGYMNSGAQVAHTSWEVAMRVLAGKGPKVRDFSFVSYKVTAANVNVVATPGKPVSWTGQPRVPGEGMSTDKQLDGYFTKPGTPTAK